MPKTGATEKLSALMTRAMHALSLTQETLGVLVGASRKTVGRWQGGSTVPQMGTIDTVARALLPVDAGLARALVLAHNARMEAAGVKEHRLPTDAFLPKRVEVESHLIDAVVYAACDAADLTPKTMRLALYAALVRAQELGLDVESVATALAPARLRKTTTISRPRSR